MPVATNLFVAAHRLALGDGMARQVEEDQVRKIQPNLGMQATRIGAVSTCPAAQPFHHAGQARKTRRDPLRHSARSIETATAAVN
jgi:hypothetical protein